MNLEKVVPLI